jgi:transposase-like protein
MSKLAMARQLNPNMLFQWRRELGAGTAGIQEGSEKPLPIVLDRHAAVAPLAEARPLQGHVDHLVRASRMPAARQIERVHLRASLSRTSSGVAAIAKTSHLFRKVTPTLSCWRERTDPAPARVARSRRPAAGAGRPLGERTPPTGCCPLDAVDWSDASQPPIETL